jgi:hypothetical protein
MLKFLKSLFAPQANNSHTPKSSKPRCGHSSVSAGLAVGCVDCALAFQRAKQEVEREMRDKGK